MPPLSLLRENVQNAYDAILQRRHIDANFTNPEILITIADHSLSICNNGIGMDEEGLKTHYWTAGSSGKTILKHEQQELLEHLVLAQWQTLVFVRN